MLEVYEIFKWCFLACLVLTGIHCYLGLHIVSRGVIFVDLSLAQMAVFGSCLALLFDCELGSSTSYFMGLLFTFIGAAIFSLSRMRDERIPQEAIIGIVYAVSSAATILVLSQAHHGFEKIKAMLDGGILYVDGHGVLKIFIIYAVIGLFHFIFRKRFLLISTNISEARDRGMKIRLWDFLFYITFGFVVTSSVQIAGVLMVFSYLVIPAVCAILFTDKILNRLIIGWAIGTVTSAIGLLASYYVTIGETQGLPSGSSVVTTFGVVLIFAALLRLVMKKLKWLWMLLKIAM
ncbi:MAG: metal ABC transporter permease [Planctomycetota bacterium]|nr:metal ABC transporter permease [Planctomycetota bacterium]MDI6788647.1 metal ABC transporter permease [Planctomycetota bacterium]